MQEIRLLSKEDIEARVAQTVERAGEVKVSLLLYKNARVDMKILDELYGPFGWKRSHKLLGDRLYCVVEVWDPDKKEWIAKEDVGVESNTEAEKGQASDSFKRACVNWGIGRELYTAPRIVITLGKDEYTKRQNGTIQVWASFSVSEISYNEEDRTIQALTLVDKSGAVRYEYKRAAVEKKPKAKKAEPKQAEAPAAKVSKTAAKPAKRSAPVRGSDDWNKWVKAVVTGWKSKGGKTAVQAFAATYATDTPDEMQDLIGCLEEDAFNYRLDTQEENAQPVNA